MEFFNKVVFPQSAEHIQLLHYLIVLIQFLFLPFLGVLLIGVFLSLRYWKRGLRENNPLFIQFSREIINSLAINKSIGFALGIVPLVTIVLIYAQLLQNSSSLTIVILLSAIPLLIIGIILIYTYKYSLSFTELFHDIDKNPALPKNLKEKITKYESGSNSLARKAGIMGFAFLGVGAWNYISAVSYAVFSDVWNASKPLTVLYSMQSLLNFVQYLLAAAAITGSTILFIFFYWEDGKKNLTEEYKNFIRNLGLTITSTAAILLPLILLINLFLTPKSAVSGSVIIYSIIAIGLIFLAYHFLYAIYKTGNLKMSGQLFFVIIFAFLALIIRDQIAMSNSTKVHSALLSGTFDKYLSELRGESTTGIQIRSGEEIFNIVCSTCHKFDEKLVGPPYNKTLVKYEGKMDQLIAFIRNPVKVDPAFPPMPNLALRPEEAKNVAEYIMEQHLNVTAPK